MKDESYKRAEIVTRIVQLRDDHRMSFAAIADMLNAEGYMPRTTKAFSGAVAFSLYNNRKLSVTA
jgi:predicted ArsR family transcriptional regulator